MKFPSIYSLFFLILRSTVVDAESHIRRHLAQNEACILVKMEVQLENGGHLEQWQCELQGSDVASMGKSFVDFEGLEEEDFEFVQSGRTTLLPGETVVVDGKLKLPKGSKSDFGKVEGRGPSAKGSKKESTSMLDESVNVRRNLAVQERKVLAVRVVAKGASTGSSLSTIGDEIFGTSGDAVNLVERFGSCSYGETVMKPFGGTTTTGVRITNGVYEVTITSRVTNRSNKDVTNDVVAALENRLGKLSTQFDHVMLCLPPGTSGNWIAWAYLNHYLSVYNNEWCNYPSAQVHEVGHNLNLQHAWYQAIEYNDMTGMMGYSYDEDTTRMCYDSAHSWQLGWYGLQRMSLDLANGAPFIGQLIGIANYQSTGSAGKYVHVRVLSSNFSQTVYVGFNLKSGINSETKDAWNQVTVHTQAGTGLSDLVAKLGSGGSHSITNFQNGETLYIDVKSINTAAQPPVANVEIYLGNCAPNNCAFQCSGGDSCVAATFQNDVCVYSTTACPGNFAIQLRTDGYPSETSWEVLDVCRGNATVFSGGSYASTYTDFSASKVLGQSRYRLRFLDSYGDGLCCGNSGATSFTATFDGLSVAAAGNNFGRETTFEFGSACAAPTNAPIAPVPQPTPAPVLPTPAPVPQPTPAPVLPTPAPDPQPTPAPVLPTPAPVPPPTPAPVLPTPAPVPPPTLAPVLPTPAPVRPTPAPVLPTLAPVPKPTPAPVGKPTKKK